MNIASITAVSAAGLLLLAARVAHAAAPATRPVPATQRFAAEIAAFEKRDQAAPPPQGAIVFTGSSSIRMWGNALAEDMKPLVAINRGFGGSTTSDLLQYMDRIVLPYRPRAIVVYCGENDIAGGATPQKVLDNMKTFVARARQALPDVRIYYISMKPSHSRWKLWDRISEGNRLIKEWAAQAGVTYIDITAAMLDADGLPRSDIFLPDRLHMNRKGYELWIPLIKKRLEADLGDGG